MKKLLFLLLLIFPFFVDASSMYQEIDILENGTIPFMSKMWAIGVIGDIFEMLGKALGGNL